MSQTPRRGLFGSMLAGRPGASSMPKIRTTFGRAALAACSTPVIVGGAFVAVLVFWLIAVAAGFPGPFGAFGGLLGVPPISTNLDVGLPSTLLAPKVALFGGLLSVVPRALILCFFTGAVTEVLDGRPVTAASVRRSLRALPTAIGVSIIGVGLWILSLLGGQLLGVGIGSLVSLGVPAIGVYLFAFATTVAITEGRRMPECLSRSVRAARMPGSSNLVTAILYTIVSLIASIFVAVKFGRLGVNPSAGAWAVMLAVNLLQVCFMAMFAYRYLATADSVPERVSPQAARAARARRNGQATGSKARPGPKGKRGTKGKPGRKR